MHLLAQCASMQHGRWLLACHHRGHPDFFTLESCLYHHSNSLQEEVMEFVNSIAKIVHMEVSLHGGAPNKNIGDAFLLVRCHKMSIQRTLVGFKLHSA